MRLTLRYLLAYLDDYLLPHDSPKILEPEDFDTIGKKIEESEFATSLVHRIEDVVRRGRLGAPSESERGTGLDPNTVAEYLDNALPDARVPDFEKVCLESDVHLAEVACCHQILAMVVTEPVEVVEETRQRIYQLPDALAMENEEALSAPVEEAAEEPRPRERTPRTESRVKAAPRKSRLPEYLRQSSRKGVLLPRWVKGLAALAALLLVALALLWVGGSSDGENPLSWILAWGRSEPDEEGASDAADRHATGVPSSPAEGGKAGSPPEPSAPAVPSGGASPAASVPAWDGKAVETSKPAAPPGTPAKPSPTEAPAPQPPPGAAAAGASAPRPAGEPEPGKSAPAKADRPPARSAAEPAGMMVSSKELLLRVNPKTGVWQRVGDETSVFVNDRLLSLPAYRSRLALNGRTSLELVNATALSLLPPAANGPAGIAIEFGQVLAKADDAAGSSLRIVAGEHSGVCQFGDADSVVAIEISRTQAGGDPETQPGPLVADLYVTSGSIAWQDDRSGKAVKVAAPRRLSVSEQPLEPVLLQQLPRWVSGEAASPLEQRAAPVLEREVTVDRSVVATLRPLTAHQRIEVRRLAMRSLALVGDYQPLISTLENREEYRFWSDYVEQLQASVFRSPQSAASVRTAMERQYRPQGVALYEMLWKYRPDTLQPDDVNHLVNFLGHDALPFRILGYWNLKNLYQNRTLGYRPDDPVAKRQAAVQKWRELLKTSPALRSGTPPPPEPSPSDEPSAVEDEKL
jgi:hypothetical protein